MVPLGRKRKDSQNRMQQRVLILRTAQFQNQDLFPRSLLRGNSDESKAPSESGIH